MILIGQKRSKEITIVNEHINAEDFRREIERRRELSPIRCRAMLADLDKRLEKEGYKLENAYIYHTKEAFFYIDSLSVKPVGDLDFVFFNDKFIIWGSIFDHHLEFSLRKNKHILTEEDKEVIKQQTIEIIENTEIFLLEDFTKDNMIFEFVGVEK